MRLSRNSSSLLCQKKRASSQKSDLTAVVSHFLQSKISWITSSSSTDGLIHPMKTMISRDLWSDASRCHRINLHDISQGTNHMTQFHQCKDWSLSWRSILMYWIFSKYANLIEDIMSRSSTDMIVMIVIIHMKNWIRSIKKQVSKNCLFCLLIAKITCQCHVRSGSVMTTHSDTWFRKRIGGIDFTRRRFALILSMYVQYPRPGVASSVCHRVYLWIDLTNCRVSQKHSRFSNQMISSRGWWFPNKAMSTHIEFYNIGVRLFATSLHAPQWSKTLSLGERFELLSCTLWRILDVWDTDQFVTTSAWQTDRVYDRTVFKDVYFLAFQVRQINSEFCWPRQERLLRDFLDKKSET